MQNFHFLSIWISKRTTLIDLFENNPLSLLLPLVLLQRFLKL